MLRCRPITSPVSPRVRSSTAAYPVTTTWTTLSATRAVRSSTDALSSRSRPAVAAGRAAPCAKTGQATSSKLAGRTQDRTEAFIDTRRLSAQASGDADLIAAHRLGSIESGVRGAEHRLTAFDVPAPSVFRRRAVLERRADEADTDGKRSSRKGMTGQHRRTGMDRLAQVVGDPVCVRGR